MLPTAVSDHVIVMNRSRFDAIPSYREPVGVTQPDSVIVLATFDEGRRSLQFMRPGTIYELSEVGADLCHMPEWAASLN